MMEYLELTVTRCGQWTGNREFIWSGLSHFHQQQICGQVWGWYVPYISYTIHYINDEGQLCNKCLQTHYLPEDHTGANLAEAMK